MSVDRTKPLTEIYHDWISSTVDDKGFEIPHALVIDQAGGMSVIALAVPPEQAYRFMLSQWEKREASEAIFALDRFAKPDQGTSLRDLMAGFHLTRKAAPRPFIVEYQHEPRIVKPIEWDNLHWNGALYGEMNAALRQSLGISKL